MTPHPWILLTNLSSLSANVINNVNALIKGNLDKVISGRRQNIELIASITNLRDIMTDDDPRWIMCTLLNVLREPWKMVQHTNKKRMAIWLIQVVDDHWCIPLSITLPGGYLTGNITHLFRYMALQRTRYAYVFYLVFKQIVYELYLHARDVVKTLTSKHK